ncbi:hypothetical protein S40285_04284 [Stachybotrys chlorohalonatus IBT 40285]|uniref:Intradiol ring-cleavage dioxygenases domain-containing protein n=1 Tax=Stachybotrys chlorohalonatus (strain IBT 40285) TaxID=1283841 RepID=A0A084QQ79_STAC4|nr:hypothetical protein S40285_04284 [Stachybotrys chlorohalonata IBT 40285]
MGDSTSSVPPLLDLTIDNITPNAIKINSQSNNARSTYLMHRLVTHLHDFARETRLSTHEWMSAIQFLTQCGQISTNVRQEFILLSDVLGLSLLIDAINHPKPASSTEGSVLGPFHTHDAPTLPSGSSMTSDPDGEPLLVLCSVCDTHGNPIPDVKVDIWETDSTGHYDVQRSGRSRPTERCVMKSDTNGEFWFKAIKPVSYPIPNDGPVGKLLGALNRHCWRPAHLHFMLEKGGWDHLITALYVRGDPYETSDAVFGVKKSLIVDIEKVGKDTAAQYGVEEGTSLLKHDFVLVSKQETEELRDRNATEALEKLGLRMKLVDHLPVPDLD